MGTKQQQIQNALNTLGWSHAKFADVLYEELYGSDDFKETDHQEINKLAQKLKKQLQRSSTNEAILDRYLRTLSEHPDYQALNLGMIQPQYVPHYCLDENMMAQLREVSIELDEEQT
ncbi:hypothetical protein [Vibrio jasicida]|uniref:hypothetical protein n=1 Tax=Vibrio jasicida TaxID=766224 RepID=UPI0007AF4CFD|nr:hypothetical protein [Vibrio jasicida]